MDYNWHFGIIWDYKIALFKAAVITLALTAVVCIVGITLGLLLALLQKVKQKILAKFIGFYITVVRAIPPLVLLLWVYYGLPLLTGIRLSSFSSAFFALSIGSSPFFAEIIRSGIEAVPKGQYESASALGFSRLHAIFRIILPQAVKQMIPPLMNECITVLKLTSLASIIAVTEIVNAANTIISNTYRPLEIYTAVALLYISIVIPFTYLSKHFEKKLSQRKKASQNYNDSPS